MKVILVCGPWGSGTTAVAGLLDRLGAIGFGPYLQTNDPRTPNAYEFIPFREWVRRHVSVETLSYRGSRPEDIEADLRALRGRIERQEFGAYDPAASPPIFLKSPASAFLLPQICRVFDVKLISVIRPLRQIEQTRLRRGWPRHHGEMGAEVIYSHLSRMIDLRAHPHMRVDYAEIVGSPLDLARRLAEFAELKAGPDQIQRAAGFIRRQSPLPSQAPRDVGR